MNFFLSLFWAVVLLLLVGLALSFYMTRRQPQSLTRSPSEFGLAFEEVEFIATDGMRLRGWWLPASGSTRAVVLLHGHGGSMDWDIHRAPDFLAAGFNVFLFDFRAHGRSQGRLATFGYLERRDVQGALAFLKSRGMKRIGLLGFSYGGIASMLTAPLCPEVAALISDGGPARLRTAIIGRCAEANIPRPLAVFLAWLIIGSASLRLGANLFRYEPLRWVGQIAPRPILFIHGELDRYLADFDELYAAAHEPKEAWRLPGVHHTKASEVYPEEFRRRVIGFFEKNL
jgi:fermentation-respiration switch protein FrsA (DUF1100 family)